MLNQEHIFVPSYWVPDRLAAGLSLLGHIAGFILVALLCRRSAVVIVPEKPVTIRMVASRSSLLFNPAKSNQSGTKVVAARIRRSIQLTSKAKEISDGDSDSVRVIRKNARNATAALVNNFRFRNIYGFMPYGEYSLAVQTKGSLPKIAPSDLPPRFEQYLVVEVTIDIEGKVVDARIITGMVDEQIQNRVLAAIRQFEYIPAKRNGSPMPSQLEVVVHIPS